MYLKSRLIFTCIVCCSLPECGNTWNVFTVSHGTFTTFPLIFFCPPRGAANTFINGILGETNLHSTWCKSLRCCGISGKPIPFAVALGGIFFFFKWLKHVLQINLFSPLRSISDTQISTAWQSGRPLLFRLMTLCLYHNCSHTQHLCTGPFATSWWKFFIKSSRDSCLLLSFLATCMLFLFESRSLSLYVLSLLTICLLFLPHSLSLSLYIKFRLAILIHFVLRSRSSSLNAGSSRAIFLLVLLTCFSRSLNSDCVLARFFHSVLYCRLLSLHLDWPELLSFISLADFCTLSFVSTFVSGCFFLNLRAKSFWDCKYLSTISCAERTLPVAESTTELFVLNNSSLFDIPDLSELFFVVSVSDIPVPILTWLSAFDCATAALC